MNIPWQVALLDALEVIDQVESPHGLYGIRDAYCRSGRLPKLPEILSSPPHKGVFSEHGLQVVKRRRDSDELWLETLERETILLQLLNYASTKVRQYGSSFRVDAHHGKTVEEPDWQLERLVPKLISRWQTGAVYGILLIAHYRQLKEFQTIIGRSGESGFLDRYKVQQFTREWSDRYVREFRTSLILWSSVLKSAEKLHS